jgi:KaiC/GvpD/RAD55 family RecA-like ATPase
VIYDDDTKFHSHNDTDPARGQTSAFDLVRLHRFGHLDDAASQAAAITDRPSYKAMVGFVNELPEIRAARAGDEFEDLGELPVKEITHEPANQEGRFRVHPAEQFSDGPPLEWIVRSLLPRAELAVIFGESGSGKSFFALDICAAITRNLGTWRSRRVSGGGVVYVCAEGSGGFKARLKAYANAHSVELAELPAVIPDAPNLLEPKEAAALTQAIVEWIARRGKPVSVVVIDTLSATAPGGNENSGEDMGRVLSHCKFLHRKTGALVILIHHSGKDATKGARGWSGLRAAADAEIEITRNGDYRAATITKMKDGSDGVSYAFKLKVIPLGLTEDGDEESSCVIEHVDAPAATAGASKQKPTGHQIILLEVLKTMAPGGTVDKEDLFNGYTAKMPKSSEGRDRRNRDAQRALEGLIAKRLAFMHENDRVSLTSLITTSEDWLQ